MFKALILFYFSYIFLSILCLAASITELHVANNFSLIRGFFEIPDKTTHIPAFVHNHY